MKWFWEAVHNSKSASSSGEEEGTEPPTDCFTTEELGAILQFATGSRQTPAGGFKELEGFNGLPTISHICSYPISRPGSERVVCPSVCARSSLGLVTMASQPFNNAVSSAPVTAGGKHNFTINRVGSRDDSSLPTAHACICTCRHQPCPPTQRSSTRPDFAQTLLIS